MKKWFSKLMVAISIGMANMLGRLQERRRLLRESKADLEKRRSKVARKLEKIDEKTDAERAKLEDKPPEARVDKLHDIMRGRSKF